ncbi:MAG: N-acyl-D-amino-acid deacylase family protein [Sphingomonadales bacterium]
MDIGKFGLIFGFVLTLHGCSEPPTEIDTLIMNGLIYDGTGSDPFEADIGIKGGKILFMGDAESSNFKALHVINADGLMVTPGFIDMHSHSEPESEYARAGLPYIYQGVTTASLGLDGNGTHEISNRYEGFKKEGIGVNHFSYVGHNWVRKQAMGEVARAPSEVEMGAMKSMIRQGMEEGAFGVSSGLFYVPGKYSETPEIIELAGIAAEYEGIYDTHDRDMGAAYNGIGYLSSIQEGIEIGEKSGTRVIFSHFNAQGAHNYGRANEGAAIINEARLRGVEVAGAQHVYNATQSSIRAYTLPPWATDGGYKATVARFDDLEALAKLDIETMEMLAIRGGASKIKLIDPNPEINGKTLDIVAFERGQTVPEAVRELYRDRQGSVMNLELYDDNNTKFLSQEDWMMTCTDGRIPHPDQVSAHPRTYGSFTKKLREYVLAEKIISMSFAVRSMSGLAADFLHLKNRGYLKVGQAADIAIFDISKIMDVTSYENPKQFSQGARFVLVNGKFALKDGAHTGKLAGVSILRDGNTF